MPRREIAPGYRTYVVLAVVQALQRAFDDFYDGDPIFRNILVAGEYPLDRSNYNRMIIVHYRGSRIFNAGVGNLEYREDTEGYVRAFLHSRFEGRIELEIIGGTTQERDILMDSVIEILTFGRLDTQLLNFFDEIYNIATLGGGQISLNTDIIDESIDPARDAPWGDEPGNILIYPGWIKLDVHGSYYSADKSGPAVPITEVDVYPYIFGHDKPEGRFDVGEWGDELHFEDNCLIVGKADIGGIEDYNLYTP